ncbi:putative bifunctional diguanylate cyclase/phosphodiesterase [Solirubrobacter pauli]|uniref:putative bifunctional diguanylate cyclase/phosphodiesterase n=1 Tax=Solirubrobacter pauli TaxID=166793 RepID=UPI001B87FBAD|nr:EAL domain-containing protein [Solirubrobacter pauli]
MGLRVIRKIEPIWGLIFALSVISAVLYFAFVRDFEAMQTPEIAWYVIAVLVLATERFPVELEFRRSSHSFSLTDIPLTVALIFTTGTHAFWAIVGGSLIALLLRRLPLIKFCFNVAQIALVANVMLVLVHLASGIDDDFGPLAWLAVLAATQLGGVLTIAQIIAAIVLTEGSVSREQVRQMFGMDFVVTLTGTAMALVSSILWIERPAATPLLALPILVAFGGYRAYVHERQGHEKVKFLYEANRTLSESPEVAIALEGLLERALGAFRAEQAEVILFAGDGGAPLRTGLGPGNAREAMALMDHDAAVALRTLAEESEDAIALTDPFPASIAAYLAGRGVRHGMLGVLRGEDRVIGTLMLANRYGLSRGFTRGDRALFETLAANASAALQFDRLEQAVTELRDLQDQLTHQAHHDPLTGLANRSLFSQRVREALESGGADKVAVMFIDLDDFKGVNDTLGHAIGDELLRGVASRLVRSVRKEDVVARLGGDEFAVLVQRDEDVEQGAAELAERTLAAFLAPVQAGEKPLNVSLSIGIAACQHNRTATDELLRDADVAMYEAKEGGKRRFAVFTPAMRDSIVRRHGLKEELARALKQRELMVQYQPIVDIGTGETISVEALVRWNHADRGRIPPAEFIPLAEDTGLIVPLGRYVLEEACQSVVARSDTLQVQVNLSAIELEHPDLIPTIQDVLRRTGIPPGRLVLEVTETLLVKDAERGAETLQQLRDLGVQLALDDFGTGYSSLSYLRNLPLDTLKIAREFVEGLAFSDHDAAFVRLIVGLAKTVGLKVVAEGIETREQLDMLREIGCDLGQGYYFAAPMDVDADWHSAPVAAALA